MSSPTAAATTTRAENLANGEAVADRPRPRASANPSPAGATSAPSVSRMASLTDAPAALAGPEPWSGTQPAGTADAAGWIAGGRAGPATAARRPAAGAPR